MAGRCCLGQRETYGLRRELTVDLKMNNKFERFMHFGWSNKTHLYMNINCHLTVVYNCRYC